MKFKLTESMGYEYLSNNPELYNYTLELDAEELYDWILNVFTLEDVASILVDYKFLKQSDVDNEEYDLEDIVHDCIVYDMGIYDLMSILEFRDIVDDFIATEEDQMIKDIEDDRSFRATHGPEI